MNHQSTGWPTPGPRLGLETTSSFSVLHADVSPPSHAPCSGSSGSSGGRRNNSSGCCGAKDIRSPQNYAFRSAAVGGAAEAPETTYTGEPGTPVAVGATGEGSGLLGREAGVVCVDVVCSYTRALVIEGLMRRSGAWRVTTDSAEATLHWGDYEMIDWERVVSGELRASSYCVRKGLSRKAQLSRYCNKYISKRPGTPLKAALPRTLVIDTWEAFDDEMNFNLGGDIAAFGSDLGVRQSVSLATRLDWCLGDAREWIEQEEEGEGEGGLRGDDVDRVAGEDGDEGPRRRRRRPRRWILKPSTLNKGVALTLGEDFATLREAVHESPDIREWVLQEYLEKPLLAEGRKFHLRAYAMAVGCIQVYLYDTVLLLRAAKQYPTPSGGDAFVDEDPLAHITNTAKQVEDETFEEEDNVWVLGDLVTELERQGLCHKDARSKVDGILGDMRILTTELFRAFRGEFAVFSPLPGCFEHFGLDFMVDEDFQVWLLEANPGPDFKQTGSRLRHVIGDLIEGTMRICLDEEDHTPLATSSNTGTATKRSSGEGFGEGSGFTLVLDEQWRGTSSAPSMKMI